MEDVQWPAEAAVIDEHLKMSPSLSHSFGRGGVSRTSSSLGRAHYAGDSLASEANDLSTQVSGISVGTAAEASIRKTHSLPLPAPAASWGGAAAPNVTSQRCRAAHLSAHEPFHIARA